tara:strand:- start:529 stop:1245 length:717 start_codon:yes stop_codon:yes gene_type:complete
MADILISAATRNQGVTPADTGRVPVAQNDPEGPVRSATRETTAFQRLSPADKTSMEALGDMRQKGDALTRVYEALKQLKPPGADINFQDSIDDVKVPNDPASVGEAIVNLNAQENPDVRRQDGGSTTAESDIQAVEDFGPEETLKTLELRSAARELEQAIIKVSQLGEEASGSAGGKVAGASLQGFVSTLSNMRAAAQNPNANQELARRTREDVVQNAELAVQSFRTISADLAKATIQ